MTLKTLENLKEINGIAVEHFYEDSDYYDETLPIYINHYSDQIVFKIKKDLTGCQVDEIIVVAKIMIEQLNKQLSCRENAMVITKLDEALLWLLKRRLDRESRGVEGINNI